jgi:hypothetical protein
MGGMPELCGKGDSNDFILQIPPSLMQISQVILLSQLQVHCHIGVRLTLLVGPPIAEVRKPVPGAVISVHEVLPSDHTD